MAQAPTSLANATEHEAAAIRNFLNTSYSTTGRLTIHPRRYEDESGKKNAAAIAAETA